MATPEGSDLPKDALTRLLDEAEGVVAPSISAVVVDGGRVTWERAPERVYDLASLTKPLCTAEVALRLVAAGRLALDAGHPLLPPGVTIRHLLQHASGWKAWEGFHVRCADRAAILAAVLATPLDHAPGTVHTYSDLGFLALGAVLEAVGGARLDAQWVGPLRWGDPRSESTGEGRGGAVHDPNARAMGGIAPHAGLFGTAREVAEVAARWLPGAALSTEIGPPLVARALVERGPGTHALGWDTPSPGGVSTAGAAPPDDAVGHLGFTGTSLWISPSRGRVAVLLTNRVAFGPDLSAIRALRRAFHQAAWDLPAGSGPRIQVTPSGPLECPP